MLLFVYNKNLLQSLSQEGGEIHVSNNLFQIIFLVKERSISQILHSCRIFHAQDEELFLVQTPSSAFFRQSNPNSLYTVAYFFSKKETYFYKKLTQEQQAEYAA